MTTLTWRPAVLMLATLLAQPLAPAAARTPAAPERFRDLHLLDSVLDIQVLGSLAGVRIVQTVRNAGAAPVDLGRHLPAVDAQVDRLTVTRDGRSIDLIAGSESDCGGEADEAHAGSVQAPFDEWAADVLGLPAGALARVEVAAVNSFDGAGALPRLPLPPTVLPIEAQVRWLGTDEGRRVMVVLPTDVAGIATLTLRPADRPARRLAIGPVDGTPAALLLPPDFDVSTAFDAGALELEIVRPGRTFWTSLAVPRAASTIAAAHRRTD